ncbi:MAG: Rieske (2Fe-2S) protein [Stellaceae bacterium]
MEPNGYAYAICNEKDIANGRCKGFTLLRVDADGTERAWNILVVRWAKAIYGYINSCPHQGVNLDWERNQFLDANRTRLICGKHGALFDIETGNCVDGPCRGARLEPIRLSIVDGDICVSGVTLVEAEDQPADDAAARSGG